MRGLPDSLAVALPEPGGLPTLERVVRSGKSFVVEARIGVGPLDGGVPMRVLGHAMCIADAVRSVGNAIGGVNRLVLFSSARKAFGVAGSGCPQHIAESAVISLAALAGALRIAGLRQPLLVDDSDPGREIPDEVCSSVEISGSLREFLESASIRNANGADPVAYAIEHAAPTMFADLSSPEDEPDLLRITIGARPEARFWAVRTRVRRAAANVGHGTVAAMAILMRTLDRAWYAPTTVEPRLRDLLETSPESSREQLDHCANPRRGGNPGLKREVRQAIAILDHPHARELALSTMTATGAADYLRGGDFQLGDRLVTNLRDLS